MSTVPEYFGSLVFDTRVMKARLSADVYRSLKHTIQKGAKLDPSVANAVAAAMKDWAVENGATHFTHWFQPMTGITAEKHDSFISPAPDGGVQQQRRGEKTAGFAPVLRRGTLHPVDTDGENDNDRRREIEEIMAVGEAERHRDRADGGIAADVNTC